MRYWGSFGTMQKKSTQSLVWVFSLTWGLPLTLAGAICWLFLSGHRHWIHCGMAFTSIGTERASFTLGPFVFLAADDSPYIQDHEVGHSWQNAVLGPFMFPFAMLPSMILCDAYLKGRISYDEYWRRYPEDWADWLGGVERQ